MPTCNKRTPMNGDHHTALCDDVKCTLFYNLLHCYGKEHMTKIMDRKEYNETEGCVSCIKYNINALVLKLINRG